MFYRRSLAPRQWGNPLIHSWGLEMPIWEDRGAEWLNGFKYGSRPLPAGRGGKEEGLALALLLSLREGKISYV